MRHRVGKVQEKRPLPPLADDPQRLLYEAPGQRVLVRGALDHSPVAHQRNVPPGRIRLGIHSREVPRPVLPDVHVVGIGNPEIAVEAMVQRQVARGVAQVPLADNGGRVTLFTQRLRKGDFPLGQAAGGPGIKHPPGRVSTHPAAHRQAPGQDRRSAGCADRRGHVKVGELDPFHRHPVKVRRADAWMTVYAQVAITLVVGEDQDDVGAQ